MFFFKQKTAYDIGVRLVGSEMCIRDRQKVVPAGGGKAIFLLPDRQPLVQLPVVIRQSAEKIVDLQDRFPGCAVGAPLALSLIHI